MTAKLVDISAHNDWPSARFVASLDGLILRCAYAHLEDAKFAQFVRNAKTLSKPWAAYHFIKPGDGAAQAEVALRVLDRVGGCPVLFMDREVEGGVIASEATADQYIARVARAGVTTGTYMSLSRYQSHGAEIDWPALWSRLVNPVLPPIYHAGDFLQYAGDNSPVGNHVDRDLFNGTPAELRELFASGRVGQVHMPPVVAVPVTALPGKGDAMFNLAPGTSDRSVTLRAGAVLYDRSSGGTRYSAVPRDQEMTFAFLGGANDKRIVVADGDYGVFAERSDIVGTLQIPKRYGK